MKTPFLTAIRRVRRKRRDVASTMPPPPPPPAGATIVNAWMEDTQALTVQFGRRVEVIEGHNVGAWMVHDDANGDIVPTEMTQVDGDTIWLFTATEMTTGTAGYSGSNHGGLHCVDGFPASDSHGY